MYRPPDIDNFHDFWAYYRNRWLGLPVTFVSTLLNKELLRGLDGVQSVPATPIEHEGEGAKMSFALYLPHNEFTASTNVVLSYKQLLANAQFGQPQIGMIEYGRSAAFYEKGSPRVAHRGLSTPRRNDFYVINGFAVRNENPQNGQLIWQCFNPTFTSFTKAVRVVQERTREAVPVAADWAVSSDGVETLLWFRSSPVAYIETGRIRMFPDKDGEAEILAMESILPTNYSIRSA